MNPGVSNMKYVTETDDGHQIGFERHAFLTLIQPVYRVYGANGWREKENPNKPNAREWVTMPTFLPNNNDGRLAAIEAATDAVEAETALDKHEASGSEGVDLDEYKEIVLLFDNDVEGRACAEKVADLLPSGKVERMPTP